jgi:pimeloyl-ACP methyl ester carboxylesterase
VSAIIIDNALIHYEALGRGKPLIFLHGWLGSWRYWMPTMEALSDRYRTYALDLWGFGDSDRNIQRYDMESYVNLLDQFMNQLGILRASLVGHSLGAAVAVLSSIRSAEHVDRVMAVSVPVMDAVISKRLNSTGGSMVDRILGRRGSTDYSQVEGESAKADPVALSNSAKSLSTLEMRRVFERVQLPTLVVHGDKDPFLSPPQIEGVSSIDDNIRPISLSESGHFPMLDEASKFQRLLRDFLETKPTDLSALVLKEEWRRRMH